MPAPRRPRAPEPTGPDDDPEPSKPLELGFAHKPPAAHKPRRPARMGGGISRRAGRAEVPRCRMIAPCTRRRIGHAGAAAMQERRDVLTTRPQPAAMTANEFHAILEAAGLNLAQAAKAIGVSIATVHRWLNDVTPISAAKAALIRERIKSEQK